MSDAEIREARTGRRRRIRLLGWKLIPVYVVLVLGLGLAAGTLWKPGQVAVLAFLRETVGSDLNGEIEVGSPLGGSLLTQVVLSEVSLVDTEGDHFIQLDTVTVDYDIFALLRGELRIRNLHARRLDLQMIQYGDGRWNFERMFSSDPPQAASHDPSDLVLPNAVLPEPVLPEPVLQESEADNSPGEPFGFVIENLIVEGGRLRTRVPLTETLTDDERIGAIQEVLEGAQLWSTFPRDDGGFDRRYEITNFKGRFSNLVLIDADEPPSFDVDALSGTLYVVSQPLPLLDLNASLQFGDTVKVDIRRFDTGRSVISGTGQVSTQGRTEHDFSLEANPLDVRDFRWLPTTLPQEGSGPAQVGIRTLPQRDAVLLTLDTDDFRFGDTRLQADLAAQLGEDPRIESLDMVFDPLGVGEVASLVDLRAGPAGWISGTMSVTGPLEEMQLGGDLSVRGLLPAGEESRFRVSGGLGVLPEGAGFSLRQMALILDEFDARWAGMFGLDAEIPGRFSGILTLDSEGDGRFRVRSGLEHTGPAGGVSALTGTGVFDSPSPVGPVGDPLPGDATDEASVDGAVVDLRVQAAPLALGSLRPWVEGLALQGDVTGPITVAGPLDDLRVTADLAAPQGGLKMEGRLGTDYELSFEGTALSLDDWIAEAPETQLGFTGRMSGEGTTPETLRASADLIFSLSEIGEADIYGGALTARAEDGLVLVDTLSMQSSMGDFGFSGSFGIARGTVGILQFGASIEDLSAWNWWLADQIADDDSDVQVGFFGDVATVLGGLPEGGTGSGARGAVTAQGTVAGGLQDNRTAIEVDIVSPGFQAFAADHVGIHLERFDSPESSGYAADLIATGLDLEGRRFDSLDVRVDRSTSSRPATVQFRAVRGPTLAVSADASVSATGPGVWDGWDVNLGSLYMQLGKLESTLTAPTRVTLSDEGLTVHPLEMSGTLGLLRTEGHIPSEGSGDLSLEIVGLQLGPFAHLFSDDPILGGTLNGAIEASGTLNAPVYGGALDVVRPSLLNQEYGRLETRFEYSDLRLAAAVDLLKENLPIVAARGVLATDLSLRPADRRLLDDALDLTIQGDSVPLALLELRVGGIESVSGSAEVDLAVRGSPGEILYTGSLDARNGGAWVPALGVSLQDAGARIRFDGVVARVDSLFVGSDFGGSLTAGGDIDISNLDDPLFDLGFEANTLHAVSRPNVSLAVSGNGKLLGSYNSPRVEGDFTLLEGDIFQEEFLRELSVIDLSDPAVYTLLDSVAVDQQRILSRFQNPFQTQLVLDANVALGPNLWMRSPQIDVELVSERLVVLMDQGADSIDITGEVEVPRGTYRFDLVPPYVQTLRITDGAIRFAGDPEVSMNMDIGAEYRNRTQEGPVVIEARITGTQGDASIDLQSNPPMSETDQLCFLAVGAPCYRSADRQLGRRLVQETVLSILGSGIQSFLVGETGISYFNLTSIGSPVGTTTGNQNVFEQSAVEFGWYPHADIFLSYWQPLAGGPPRATAEWSFLPNWRAQAHTASRFDERLFGLTWGTNLANDRTFGLFLYREWPLGGDR